MNTSCPNCGGTFTAAEYNHPSCKYCGTVLPNYASAADKVAQVQALMADSDGSGIPNALKGMVGPYAPFVQPGVQPYAGPRVEGVPNPPPFAGSRRPGDPIANAFGPAGAVFVQAERSIKRMVLIAFLVPAVLILVVVLAILGVASSAVRSAAPPPPTTHGHH